LPPAKHFVEIGLRGRVVLLRGAPIPLHRFRIVLGDPFPFFVQDTELELRGRIVSHCGALIPLRRFPIVLGDPFPFFVQHPKIALRRRKPPYFNAASRYHFAASR
jgi:hypothetical protein